MKKGSFLYWVVFALLCIWQLPQFLCSLVCLLYYKDIKVRRHEHFNICFTETGARIGVCLGPFSIVYNKYTDAVVSHEMDGHSVDSKIFGPLYLLIIGIPSALNNMFRFTENYYDFYPERWANKHAKLHTDPKYGFLLFDANNSDTYPENYPN